MIKVTIRNSSSSSRRIGIGVSKLKVSRVTVEGVGVMMRGLVESRVRLINTNSTNSSSGFRVIERGIEWEKEKEEKKEEKEDRKKDYESNEVTRILRSDIAYPKLLRIISQKSITKLNTKLIKFNQFELYPSLNTMKKLLLLACLNEVELLHLTQVTHHHQNNHQNHSSSNINLREIVNSAREFFYKDIGSIHEERKLNNPIREFLTNYQPLLQSDRGVNREEKDMEGEEEEEEDREWWKVSRVEDHIRKLFKLMLRRGEDNSRRVVICFYFLDIFLTRKDTVMVRSVYGQVMIMVRDIHSLILSRRLPQLISGSLRLEPDLGVDLLAKLLLISRSPTDLKGLDFILKDSIRHLTRNSHPDKLASLKRFYDFLANPPHRHRIAYLLSIFEDPVQRMYGGIVTYHSLTNYHGKRTSLSNPIEGFLNLNSNSAWPQPQPIVYLIALRCLFDTEPPPGIPQVTVTLEALEIFQLAKLNRGMDSHLLNYLLRRLINLEEWQLSNKIFLETPILRDLNLYRTIFISLSRQDLDKDTLFQFLTSLKEDNLPVDLPLFTQLIQLLFKVGCWSEGLQLATGFLLTTDALGDSHFLTTYRTLIPSHHHTPDERFYAVLFKGIGQLDPTQYQYRTILTHLLTHHPTPTPPSTTTLPPPTSTSPHLFYLTSQLTLQSKLQDISGLHLTLHHLLLNHHPDQLDNFVLSHIIRILLRSPVPFPFDLNSSFYPTLGGDEGENEIEEGDDELLPHPSHPNYHLIRPIINYLRHYRRHPPPPTHHHHSVLPYNNLSESLHHHSQPHSPSPPS